MSRSSRSCPARISAAAARTESSEARSRRTTETVVPGAEAVTRAAAASALPTSRQARTVSAPRRARTAAASNPIPEFAPVTTAVRPRWPGTSATVHGPCLTLIARVLPRSRPRSGGGRVSRLPRRVETEDRRGGWAVRARREARAQAATLRLMHIPSPPANGFHLGPVYVHYYGLMYVIGITLAILITQRRWQRMGGDAALVGDVALWAVPAGIIGGRIYFDITTPQFIPHHWYGIFAVWDGGLGIWGGIALGAAAGIWRVRRAGANAGAFADAVAPALLVAQAVGRVGNYFNRELFGGPTSLPW